MTDRQGSDDLESQLSAMLQRRAEVVQTAPVLDVDPAPSRAHRRRGNPLLTLSAVAATVVVIMTLASLVVFRHHAQPRGVGGNGTSTDSPCVVVTAAPGGLLPQQVPPTSAGQSTPYCPIAATSRATNATGTTSTPTLLAASTCPISNSKLQTLLNAHVQSVDQPINTPLAPAPGGAFVMQQKRRTNGQGDLVHNELAYFSAAGHGVTMWTATQPELQDATVSPDAAASSDWVVFAIDNNRHQSSYAVMAWNVHSHLLVTVRAASSRDRLQQDPEPIVIDDTAYWLESTAANPSAQRLITWDLTSNQQIGGSAPVSRASRLIRFGQQVGLVQSVANSDTYRLASGPAASLPAAVRTRSSNVDYPTADATTVRWSTPTASGPVLRTWVVGSSTVTSIRLGTANGPSAHAGPLLYFPDDGGRLADIRTGRTVSLPTGVSVSLGTGEDVIVTRLAANSSENTRISRVPLAALTALFCS